MNGTDEWKRKWTRKGLKKRKIRELQLIKSVLWQRTHFAGLHCFRYTMFQLASVFETAKWCFFFRVYTSTNESKYILSRNDKNYTWISNLHNIFFNWIHFIDFNSVTKLDILIFVNLNFKFSLLSFLVPLNYLDKVTLLFRGNHSSIEWKWKSLDVLPFISEVFWD